MNRNFYQVNKSFAEIVSGRKAHPQSRDQQPPPTPSSPKIKMTSTFETLEFMQRALVGVMENFQALMNVKAFCEVEECPTIMMRYLGGLKMLVEFESKQENEKFLVEGEQIWKPWFKEMYPWDPKENFTERIASILIYGVPQHAWCEEAFSAITKTWGRVIIPDECSTDNTNMAFGRVGIITSQPGSISQTITIKVDNDVFNIIVMEDILESNRLNPIIASNDFITSPVWKDWGRNCDYSEEEEDEDDGEEIREWEYNGNNRSPEQAPTKSRWTENFKAGIEESLPHNDWGREDAHSKASKPETPNKSLDDASPTSDAHSNRWSKMTNPHNLDHITQNTDSPIQESATQVAQNSSPVPETQINSEK
uniref:DUF4283 domain-containing protein n=1 Tax=Lactuca sativa TaxID=4236 RepID=A0A9R1VVQ1_LACSA|nr:hypothetical protein LSAT_V11C400222230 [Lactuca sativa]